jgi:hypothetical protein
MIPELQNYANDIVLSYLNGKSVLSLSKQYNTSTYIIQSILDKNNMPKISQAKRLNPSFIEDYFKIIDTKEKAYWIGWLLTDGGVMKDNDIQLSLSSHDAYILHLLEDDLHLSGKVFLYCDDKYARFHIGSVNMCKDLEQYGIVPNKTLALKFPKNIPEELETHLLRGMFDGDGGFTIGVSTKFYKHRNKSYTRPYQELSFTGTYDMCENFQRILCKHTGVPYKKITKNHSIYRVRWSNKDEVISICKVLYNNCDQHFLKRKYDKYQELLNGG